MTTTYVVEHIVCRGCFAVLDVEDNFCRHCGAATHEGCAEEASAAIAARPGPSPQVSPSPTPTATGKVPISENPWVVLGVLFLVMGPLGLPMLWRSRAFATWSKVAISAIVLLICVAAGALIWMLLERTLASLSQLDVLRPQ